MEALLLLDPIDAPSIGRQVAERVHWLGIPLQPFLSTAGKYLALARPFSFPDIAKAISTLRAGFKLS